jgi:hypothetical protein
VSRDGHFDEVDYTNLIWNAFIILYALNFILKYIFGVSL